MINTNPGFMDCSVKQLPHQFKFLESFYKVLLELHTYSLLLLYMQHLWHISETQKTWNLMEYLGFQGYPFVLSVHVTHKDPSGQGNLHTLASIKWMKIVTFCLCVVYGSRIMRKERNKNTAVEWSFYLCSLESRVSLGFLFVQESQESPFVLDYQEIPSVHLSLTERNAEYKTESKWESKPAM